MAFIKSFRLLRSFIKVPLNTCLISIIRMEHALNVFRCRDMVHNRSKAEIVFGDIYIADFPCKGIDVLEEVLANGSEGRKGGVFSVLKRV